MNRYVGKLQRCSFDWTRKLSNLLWNVLLTDSPLVLLCVAGLGVALLPPVCRLAQAVASMLLCRASRHCLVVSHARLLVHLKILYHRSAAADLPFMFLHSKKIIMHQWKWNKDEKYIVSFTWLLKWNQHHVQSHIIFSFIVYWYIFSRYVFSY